MSDFKNLDDLIRSLPHERQAEVYQIAHALNIKAGAGDEFLFSILVGLGYHKTILTGTPDAISKSGDEAVEKINTAISLIQDGAQAAIAEINKTISAGSGEVQMAAQKGAAIAFQNADLTQLLEKIEKAQSKASAKIWFSRAMLATSSVIIVISLISGVAGYYIKSALNPEFATRDHKLALFYQHQLDCTAVNAEGYFYCTDRNGSKGRVAFKFSTDIK